MACFTWPVEPLCVQRSFLLVAFSRLNGARHGGYWWYICQVRLHYPTRSPSTCSLSQSTTRGFIALGVYWHSYVPLFQRGAGGGVVAAAEPTLQCWRVNVCPNPNLTHYLVYQLHCRTTPHVHIQTRVHE